MNTLTILAASLLTGSSMVSLLIQVAIAAVVIWAIIALIRWSGIPIPQPVIIILTALVAIFLILWMARIFGILT